MGLINQIKKELIQAMKEKDTSKLSTLRLLIAEFEKEKVSMKLADVTELSDEQVQSVIGRQIKKLDKEIEAYVAVGRETNSQEVEKELLTSYMPKQLSLDEVASIVKEIALSTKEAGQNIGVAMKSLSFKLKGKADMKVVSQLAREQFKND